MPSATDCNSDDIRIKPRKRRVYAAYCNDKMCFMRKRDGAKPPRFFRRTCVFTSGSRCVNINTIRCAGGRPPSGNGNTKAKEKSVGCGDCRVCGGACPDCRRGVCAVRVVGVRVGCTLSDPMDWTGVDIGAFVKPDGSVVVVAVNDGAAKSLRLDGLEGFEGRTATAVCTDAEREAEESAFVFGGGVELAADSVTTFVFSAV